jgi:hypothetical protein
VLAAKEQRERGGSEVHSFKRDFRTHGQRKANSRFCRFSGSGSDVVEDSIFVGYHTASFGNPLLTFQDHSHLETLGTDYPVSQCYIPEE